ncbi:putative AAA+ ATPase domain, ATPase, AAA-type, core [Helianthus debilis subsp. tardiflorus]
MRGKPLRSSPLITTSNFWRCRCVNSIRCGHRCLDHPATFATLALAVDVKESVINDLKRFVEGRDYYRRVGKAWKRGYLLYGPPGTGKSSLNAAMAYYLNFDIYDLELANMTNSTLRQLLLASANRSILVVEDIDCSLELHDRTNANGVTGNRYHQQQRVTLSGFLNFIDGLWSSCGDERIIVFTTNRKEKLDPALLRPGRMDRIAPRVGLGCWRLTIMVSLNMHY